MNQEWSWKIHVSVLEITIIVAGPDVGMGWMCLILGLWDN